jgi:hypothetical protein
VAAVKAAGYEYIPQLKALEKMDPALKKAGVKKLAMRKTVKRAIEESAETHGDGKVERFEIASWWASKCWRKTSCVTCKNTPTCGWCLKKERCVADVPELCLGPGDHAGEYEWSIGQVSFVDAAQQPCNCRATGAHLTRVKRVPTAGRETKPGGRCCCCCC